MKLILFTVNVVLYLSLSSIAMFGFWLYRPFQYTDNGTSTVLCNKNSTSVQIGMNSIFTLGQSLDYYNDKKARKLCEYNIIRDYYDQYKTPEKVNYTFLPQKTQYSGWSEAVLVFMIIIACGMLLIESVNNLINKKHIFNPLVFFLALTLALPVFFLYIKQPATKLYCSIKINTKIDNFHRSMIRMGVISSPEDESYIKNQSSNLNQKCMQEEALKIL